MQLIPIGDNHHIVTFSKNEINDVRDILKTYKEDQLIYVAYDGTDDKYLSSDRFFVKNPTASFVNHMMWEGILSDEDQLQYIEKCAQRFLDEGRRFTIEEYSFQEDEPFYDYSK